MDMTGEYRIPAPREMVWRALNDPDLLKACIPGCEEIQKISDTEFTAKVTTKVGPVSAKFGGRVQLLDLDPPNGYRIQGEGQGGAAGFAKGGATVRLSDDGPAGTLLAYEAQAQVGGKLAQIGSRLVAGTAKKLADQFFGCFAAKLGAAAAAPAVAAEAPAMATGPVAAVPASGSAVPPTVTPELPRGGITPWLWIVVVLAIVAVLLLIFGRP